MIGMILVDNQGPSPPWFLDHAQWDGVTPADFIFPSFIFIMGMAIPLSLNSTNKQLSIRNIIRIVALFAIGVFINLSARKFTFNHFRILGILQRLSLCYALLVFVHFVTKYGQRSLRFVGAAISIGIAAVYLGFMLSFENQEIGCHKQNNLQAFCNFGAYLDRMIFTKNHMIYPNDPEGLFTTLSAYLNGYAGYFFCLVMQENRSNIKKTLLSWTMISTFSLIIMVPLLFLMPLCKKIWSISFVFCTIGVSGFSLVLLTLLIDIFMQQAMTYQRVKEKIIAPFIWLGRNPLAIFVLMDALAILMIDYIIINEKSLWHLFYHYVFASWISNTYICSTIFALFFAVLWTLVSYILFRNNIFVRL